MSNLVSVLLGFEFAEDIKRLADATEGIYRELQTLNKGQADLKEIVETVSYDINIIRRRIPWIVEHTVGADPEFDVVGIKTKPGPVTPHKEAKVMAAKWSVMKKGAMRMGASMKAKMGDPAPVAFVLVDNGDSTFSVMGADAVGNAVDISSVASLAASSDTPTVVTVDPPTGMTFGVHAVGPIGSAKISVTATWNDGSLGPFSAEVDVTTATGPAGSIVVTPGPVTTH